MCNSTTTIDYILASYPKRVTQQGIIDVRLSDHQLIYCTRKISWIKETLTSINFRNYQNFNDTTGAYDSGTTFRKLWLQLMRWIKHNSLEWLDGLISEAIKTCDKLFKKFKNLHYKSISNYDMA